MLARIFSFSCGIVLIQQLTVLPTAEWGWLIPIVLLLTWRSYFFPHVVWFLFGLLWCFGSAWWLLQQGIDEQNEGQNLLISGEVVSLPQQTARGRRFIFEVDTLPQLERPLGRIQLNWYNQDKKIAIGERWQFQVRLKQPSGFINSGGFDYEAWLFQKKIRAKGYVRNSKQDQNFNQRLSEAQGHWVDRKRLWLSEQFDLALPDSEFVGMIQALSVGMRLKMSDEQWQVLTATGTNHLMAISGLHVGLVAGLLMWLVMRCWHGSEYLCLKLPARKAGAIAGFSAALFYAALAGFAIPTQRALIMLTVVFVGLFLQRQLTVIPVLATAWFLVLLVDPFATLSMGFWLSFAAVAIITYSMGARSHTRSLSWRWGRVHWVISIGLLPLLLFSFSKAPLYSFIANFIAVPVVGLLVVPLVLLASLMMLIYRDMAYWILSVVDQLFAWLWPLLQAIANWPAAQWLQHQPLWWSLPCAMLGIILLLAPKGWPGRWLGMIFIAPMFLLTPSRPNTNELWMTVVDVGQGLSVVLRTENNILVYDTGPTMGTLSSAQLALVPYLRSQGIDQIDKLLVSHDDSDHSGGADYLLSEISVGQLITPGITRYKHEHHQTCQAGQKWEWDGVKFEILHPVQWSDWAQDNDRSCVLKVDAIGGTVLITGDASQRIEKRLVDQYGSSLLADILLAGHHGSKSSSSQIFIEQVAPDYVIFSTGYRNRYAFPHSVVTQRFGDLGVKLLNSAQSGGIRFKILPQQGILAPEEFRKTMDRLWRRH